jgi:stress-induced morphogen
MSANEIENLLRKSFPDSKIEVVDTMGDEDHYEVRISSTHFYGKTKIQQHQMVFQALEGSVGGKVHALSLKTHPLISNENCY